MRNLLLNYGKLSCIIIAFFRQCDGMVDVTDSKSVGGDTVWVRVPPLAPKSLQPFGCGDFVVSGGVKGPLGSTPSCGVKDLWLDDCVQGKFCGWLQKQYAYRL